MVEIDQHLQMGLAHGFDVDQGDQAIDVRVDGVLDIGDVAHLVEVHATDVLPEEDVLQLPLRLLVEHHAVAVEQPDVRRAAVERGHLDMHGARHGVFPRVDLHHRDGQLRQIDDGRPG